jgi:hypothetical protein
VVRATGEEKAIHALIASHRKFGKMLSELQLSLVSQTRKACKRIAGGGKTSKGEAAVCLLLVNYGHLVRGAHADQQGEFEAEAAEMLPTARSLADSAEAERLKVKEKAKVLADADAERKAADRQKKKGKAKKYYAVAVGRSHGIYTDWDEVESYVCGFSGSAHKSFKSRREAKVWYDKKRRIHRRRRQRRGPPDASSSSSDDSRGSRSRRSRRRHRRSRSRVSSSSSSSSGSSGSGGNHFLSS